MSVTLPPARVRISVDPVVHNGLSCRLTSSAPKIWRGNNVGVEIGMYMSGVFVDTFTGITSLHLDLVPANDRDGSPILQKTVLAAAFETITEAEWLANTAAKYQAKFTLTSADTQVDMTNATDNVLSLWLVIHALMATGEFITLGAGTFQVEEDGAQNGLTVNSPSPAYRIQDGEVQIWNPDQSLWHTLVIRGAAGAETLAIGPGEA
jgi:hypothetical protein